MEWCQCTRGGRRGRCQANRKHGAVEQLYLQRAQYRQICEQLTAETITILFVVSKPQLCFVFSFQRREGCCLCELCRP